MNPVKDYDVQTTSSESKVAMTRTLHRTAFRHWMLAILLALGVIASVPQARAQEMTSNVEADMALINNALSATLAAASANNLPAARVSMEQLYRLWRTFRQRNIEGRPQDPQFAPTLVKAEERLYAASLQVDQEKLAAAAAELEEARKLLNSLGGTVSNEK